MKQKFFSLLSIMIATALCVGFASCGGSDDKNEEIGEYTSNNNDRNYNAYEKDIVTKLTKTSWHLWKSINTYSPGEEEVRYKDATISFAEDEKLYYNNCFLYGSTYIYGDGDWYLKDNKLILLAGSNLKPEDQGSLVAMFGVELDIIELNDEQMITTSGNGFTTYYYTKVAYVGNDNSENGGDNNGGDNNGEPPYVTSFTFTATKSSITVKFMCSERPTSASVKYGETSATKSVSSTISGKQVTATASGLKAGTKYYFKCTVKNGSGSTVSDDWPAITNN